MKKILTSLVVSLATLTSTVTIAAPNFDRGSDMGGPPVIAVKVLIAQIVLIAIRMTRFVRSAAFVKNKAYSA